MEKEAQIRTPDKVDALKNKQINKLINIYTQSFNVYDKTCPRV